MLNKYFNVLIFAVITFTVIGCSSAELTKFSDDNKCKTTIEGNYYKVGKMEYSMLYLKSERYPKQVLGTLVSFDSTGALFDPANMKMSDEDTSLVPIDTIYGLVDHLGELIYGEIPDYWAKDLSKNIKNHKLWIGLTETSTKMYYELRLQPNEPFSYCIAPGNYEITLLDFYEDKDIADKGYDFGKILFTAQPNVVNYLGNIYADYKTAGEENTIIVPCSYYNGGASSTAGMFGLIGSLTYAIANEIANSDLQHVIHIERDKNFIPEANYEVSEVEINVTLEEE